MLYKDFYRNRLRPFEFGVLPRWQELSSKQKLLAIPPARSRGHKLTYMCHRLNML